MNSHSGSFDTSRCAHAHADDIDLLYNNYTRMSDIDSANEFKICRKRAHRKRALNPDDSDEEEQSEHRRLMANSQERVRMQRINTALDELKDVLPAEYHPCRRRMSKIRTLRSAMEYISGLSAMLESDDCRRRQVYMQAKEYVTGGDTNSNNEPQYSAVRAASMNMDTLDICQTTPLAPYYPYLGPLCSEFIDPMYQTPEQTPPKQMTANPRCLNFNAPIKRLRPTTTDVTPTSYSKHDVKPVKNVPRKPPSMQHPCYQFRSFDGKPTFSGAKIVGHEVNPARRHSIKSETFTSPPFSVSDCYGVDGSRATFSYATDVTSQTRRENRSSSTAHDGN